MQEECGGREGGGDLSCGGLRTLFRILSADGNSAVHNGKKVLRALSWINEAQIFVVLFGSANALMGITIHYLAECIDCRWQMPRPHKAHEHKERRCLFYDSLLLRNALSCGDESTRKNFRVLAQRYRIRSFFLCLPSACSQTNATS